MDDKRPYHTYKKQTLISEHYYFEKYFDLYIYAFEDLARMNDFRVRVNVKLETKEKSSFYSMCKSTIEGRIAELTDLDNLERIGKKYANGGNYTTALLAWMRAEELGCTKYRINIVALLFKNDIQGYERQRAEAMVKQWLKDGDADVQESLRVLKSVYINSGTDAKDNT